MKLTHIQRHDQSKRHVPVPLSRPQWASGLCTSSPFLLMDGNGESDGEPLATGVIPYIPGLLYDGRLSLRICFLVYTRGSLLL